MMASQVVVTAFAGLISFLRRASVLAFLRMNLSNSANKIASIQSTVHVSAAHCAAARRRNVQMPPAYAPFKQAQAVGEQAKPQGGGSGQGAMLPADDMRHAATAGVPAPTMGRANQ